MDSFSVKSDDRILFLGEGNFSFCVGFIKYNGVFEKSGSLQGPLSTKIIATCFESNDNFSKIKEHNIKLLQERGVTVLFNVDATRLKDYPIIANEKFTKIIFNFPHVGGKMKINLNRKLLADSFLSTKDVLDENGVILLTLCDGQGGTSADKNKRRWDDTWKVVEMAGQADFALKNVHPFLHEVFPGYINTGYRSLEKGFNVDRALTHVFKICKPPLFANLSDDEILLLFQAEEISTSFGKETVSKVHSKKISHNLFNDKFTLHSYLYDFIKNMQFAKDVTFYDNYDLIYGVSCRHSVACDSIKENLTSHLNYSKNIEVFKGLSLNKLSNNFLQAPVNCDIICVGNECCIYSKQIITKFLALFGCSDNVMKQTETGDLCLVKSCNTYDVLNISSFLLGDDYIIDICIIHVDALAMFLLNLNSWHELWAEGNKIEINEGKVKLLTPCLFPCSYTFDLSLSTRDNYVEGEFYNILWHVAGSIIFNVSLISTYQPPNGNTNICYRISYRSYEVPLHRKGVIDIQHNVIGRLLERMLNVTVL